MRGSSMLRPYTVSIYYEWAQYNEFEFDSGLILSL